MSLASELLEKGQRDVVIEYLQLCANFWQEGKELLTEWISAIKKGETPDFIGILNFLIPTEFVVSGRMEKISRMIPGSVPYCVARKKTQM